MAVEMGTVWDRTTEFLSDNFGSIAGVAAIAIWLPATVSGVFKGATPQLGSGPAYLAMIVMSLPAIWGQLFVIGLAFAPDAGRPAAQGVASRAFLPAVLAMVLLFAALMVLSLPLGVALASSGIDLEALRKGQDSAFATMSGAAAGFMVLYGLAFSVALVVLLARLMLLYPAVAAEGGVIAAIRHAFALTRGLFWRILGVMLLFGLVYGVAMMAIGSAFGLIFRLLAPGAGPFGPGAIIVALLLGLVQTAYTLLLSAFSAKLYLAVTGGVSAAEAKPAA